MSEETINISTPEEETPLIERRRLSQKNTKLIITLSIFSIVSTLVSVGYNFASYKANISSLFKGQDTRIDKLELRIDSKFDAIDKDISVLNSKVEAYSIVLLETQTEFTEMKIGNATSLAQIQTDLKHVQSLLVRVLDNVIIKND